MSMTRRHERGARSDSRLEQRTVECRALGDFERGVWKRHDRLAPLASDREPRRADFRGADWRVGHRLADER
jgi:hypothetical protein